MRYSTLRRRSLVFHWRVHLATAACAAVAATALTGSLIVGDSMRGSLRAHALDRLGPVQHALISTHFFREELAGEITAERLFQERFSGACPLILARGAVERPDSGIAVRHVSVMGVDGRFWRFAATATPGRAEAADGSVVINAALATRLGIHAGADILVRLGAEHRVPAETLLGRADRNTASLRLTVAEILPAGGVGGLDLNLSQNEPLNVYIPLAALQRALKLRDRVNALLVSGPSDPAGNFDESATLRDLLASRIQLADLGLHFRRNDLQGVAVLESERLLIEPPIEAAAMEAAAKTRVPTVPVLTYLANSITLESHDSSTTRPAASAVRQEIPYSTVTAIGRWPATTIPAMTLIDGTPAPALQEAEVFLNEWAAHDLNAAIGDRVRLSYYAADAYHHLSTESALFTIRGILGMNDLAIDRTLAPEYEGMTDAKHLTDWDPPFPMDMKRIRERDEEYWHRHGPAAKAFIAIETGQRLWTQAQLRFGRITSLRLGPLPGRSAAELAAVFETELIKRLTPAAAGLSFEPVRARALTSSAGNTDFSMLFLAFSVFIIASSAILMALIFRLGIESRSRELGLLLALGFSQRTLAWHLLKEAAWPAVAGVSVGLISAVAYAALMLAGLRSWWADAVRADFLSLHASPATLLTGWLAGVLITLLSTLTSIRAVSRTSPRRLLVGAGGERPAVGCQHRMWVSAGMTVLGAASTVGLVVLSLFKIIPAPAAFFGSGACLLIAAISAARLYLARAHHAINRCGGSAALVRLGLRNAARNPLRTSRTIALIAAAAFIVTAVGASRRGADDENGLTSGNGGFAFVGESAVPIMQDLRTAEGRRNLGLSPTTQTLLETAAVIPCRLRSGDEASCLGLYRPTEPRLLGAPDDLIARGGFRFRASLAQTPEERANPWLLLNRPCADGAIPTIGDDSTVTWLLHLGLGEDLAQTDERGRTIRLRFVALLSSSLLQSELVIGEKPFVESFPSLAGSRFLLLSAPGDHAHLLADGLQRDLSHYGLELEPTATRLARYLAVENAYLSAFETLGGLGMVLGTLGLGAVLWRNLLDRRGELAVLRALGFSRSHLHLMAWAEHAAILVYATAAGALSGVVAVLPEALSAGQTQAWGSVSLTLAAIVFSGMVAVAAALKYGVQRPILTSLRND